MEKIRQWKVYCIMCRIKVRRCMKDKWSVPELYRLPSERQGDQSLAQTPCETRDLVTVTQSVLHRLAALALPGSWSETQHL